MYQGEELGLFEVADIPWAALEDPTATDTRTEAREGARQLRRVPLPWVAADDPARADRLGFHRPTPMRRPICRSLHGFPITLPIEKKRTRHRCLRSIVTPSGCGASCGRCANDLAWLDLDGRTGLADGAEGAEGGVIAYRRDNGWACVTNFGAAPVELPAGRVLLTSSPLADGRLAQDSSAWIMLGEM